MTSTLFTRTSPGDILSCLISMFPAPTVAMSPRQSTEPFRLFRVNDKVEVLNPTLFQTLNKGRGIQTSIPPEVLALQSRPLEVTEVLDCPFFRRNRGESYLTFKDVPGKFLSIFFIIAVQPASDDL